MSEQERKPPMQLRILRVVWRVLSPLLQFIEPKLFFWIFRAIAHFVGFLFGYEVKDVLGHAFRIEFSKKKQQ